MVVFFLILIHSVCLVEGSIEMAAAFWPTGRRGQRTYSLWPSWHHKILQISQKAISRNIRQKLTTICLRPRGIRTHRPRTAAWPWPPAGGACLLPHGPLHHWPFSVRATSPNAMPTGWSSCSSSSSFSHEAVSVSRTGQHVPVARSPAGKGSFWFTIRALRK